MSLTKLTQLFGKYVSPDVCKEVRKDLAFSDSQYATFGFPGILNDEYEGILKLDEQCKYNPDRILKEQIKARLIGLLKQLNVQTYIEIVAHLDAKANKIRDLSRGTEDPEKIGLFKHYRLEKAISEGGSAVVWKALDLQLQRNVAIKFFCPINESDNDSFISEMLHQAGLSFPGVITPIRIARIDLASIKHLVEHAEPKRSWSGLIAVLPLIDGGLTLKNWIYNNRSSPNEHESRYIPDWDELTSITGQILLSMKQVHACDKVHLDIKPANILIEKAGSGLRTYITDFLVPGAKTGSAGTPGYQSPEQKISTGAVFGSKAADIYSIGQVIFEILTGANCFFHSDESPSPSALTPNLSKLDQYSNKADSADLKAILRKCLEVDRINRYQDAGDLYDDFQRLFALKPLKHAGSQSIRHKFGLSQNLWVKKIDFVRIMSKMTYGFHGVGHKLTLFVRRERTMSSLITVIAFLSCLLISGLFVSVRWVNSLNKVLEVKNKDLQFQISEIVHRDVLRLKVALLRALEKSDKPEDVFGIMFVDSWFANCEEDRIRINDESLYEIASLFANIGVDWDHSGKKFPDGWEDSFSKALETTAEPREARVSVVSQMYFISRLAWFAHLVKNDNTAEAFIQLGELERIRMRPEDEYLSGVWPQVDRLTAFALVDCIDKFKGKESIQKWEQHFLDALKVLDDAKRQLILDRFFSKLLTSKYDKEVLKSIGQFLPESHSLTSTILRLNFAILLSMAYKSKEAKEQYALVLANKAEELDGSDADKAKLLSTLTIAIYPSLTYLRDEKLFGQLVTLQNALMTRWKIQVENQLDKHVDGRNEEETRIKSSLKVFYDIANGKIHSDSIVKEVRELLDHDIPIARITAVKFIADSLARFERNDVSRAFEVLKHGLNCGFVEQDEFDTLQRKLKSQ